MFFWKTSEIAERPFGVSALPALEREFFTDNLLVQIRFIIVMTRWTGFAPWEFESPFPGSLACTFLVLEVGPNRRFHISDVLAGRGEFAFFSREMAQISPPALRVGPTPLENLLVLDLFP